MRAAAAAILALVLAACASGPSPAPAPAPRPWIMTKLVQGSAFHGVHGIRLSPDGQLYAGSVAGQSLYRISPETGGATLVVGPPQGQADDIAFGPGGQMVWTAISQGIVYSRRGDGPVEVLARIPSINSIAFSRDGRRLFAAQVFGGDDLWELDPTGQKPPRKIREKMGGFNSFWPGPDGWLYGPLWFKGQVVRVNPDTGELVVVAQGVGTPASVKFDSRDNLYVIDTATGQLLRIDRASGEAQLVVQLQPSLDNFTIGPNDHAFVTNMADNGVQEIDLRGQRIRQVMRGALAYPIDLAVAGGPDGETLYVADSFAFRAVDGRSGVVRDLERAHAAGSRLTYPNAVGAGPRHAVVPAGTNVLLYAHGAGGYASTLRGFGAVADAVELADGDVLALERSGRLVRARGEAKTVVAEGLTGAISLAASADGRVAYVSHPAAGKITRIDLASGARSDAATGLAMPRGIAVAPDGAVVVLEVGAKQVSRILPNGAKEVVAQNLPVGLITTPIPAAGGVAVGPSGTIYVASDVENAIYRISR
ncbi:SMP-30/gluconolactonase/LRE family protein [Phenylobacterium sp.]|jgi:sugar lactone lactonase YvrE|uniref:SMP-30/gluconolactonase/LRE family protein n=1 Tax=Phenylobacterium sp. TaxID=1871053 RepID=UPI002F94BEEC